MLETVMLLLSMSALQAQPAHPSPKPLEDERLGTGASDMVEPEEIPLSEDPAAAKGLADVRLVPYSMRTHVQKGSDRRQGNGLRNLSAEAGSPNKVLPMSHDFNTPNSESIFKTGLTWPLDRAAAAARSLSEETFGATFTPAAAMTWQRATKVLPGAPHGKGLVWYGADGDLRLWADKEGTGGVVYNLQGNDGVGSPFNPIMGQNVANPLANNNIIISSNFGVYMLYWQQSMLENRMRLRVGKVEGQVFFDRNAIAYDPIGGFLAQNFNQSSAIPFPTYAFGGVLSYDLQPDLTLRGGVFNAASVGTTAGFDGMAADRLFAIAELDNRIWLPLGEYYWEGHQRLIVWHKGIADWETGQGSQDGWGVAFNMDQAVAKNIAVFLRAAWGSQVVAPTNVAISAGFAVNAVLPKTDMGLALGWSHVTRYGRSASGVNAPAGDQLLLEWYARVHVSPALHAGPVVQIVRDPAAGIDTSVIYGMRANWAF